MHSQAEDEDNEAVDYAQFLLDNLDQVEEYSQAFHVKSFITSILLNNCPDFLALTMNGSHKLVLDSASTLNLITSKGLLHNIHRVKMTMRVFCNAGVTTTNLMGWLGDYPNPVWYNPNGVANILSLFLVQRYYWVQYDNEIEDAFHVTMKDAWYNYLVQAIREGTVHLRWTHWKR